MYFCPHFYAAYKNEEMIFAPFIIRSPKLGETILGYRVWIGKIYLQFGSAGQLFNNECFHELKKHLIQMYTGQMSEFWYFVKSKL